MRKDYFIAIFFGLFLTTACKAESIQEKGKKKAAICAACHGINGTSRIPIYPNIAGQKKAYLEMTLKAYRSKERNGLQAEAMYAIAAQLSDDDIKALAAYFSAIKK